MLLKIWGITLGGTVIQNALKTKLPSALLSQLPQGTSIVYSLVEVIPTLDEPLRSTVKDAFSDALRTFYFGLIGVAALGFAASLLMKALPLHTAVDRRFALQDGTTGEIPVKKDVESAMSSVDGLIPPRE